MSALLTRNIAWLAFFAAILGAWVWLYLMATRMGLDLIGRPSMPMDMDMSMGSGMDMGADTEMGSAMDMADTEMPGADDAAAPEGGAMSPEMDSMGSNEMPMDGMGSDDMDMSDDMPMDGSMEMDGMSMDGMSMDMSAMTRFAPVWGMWSVMMAAMMLPTMVPTLRTYETLMHSADGTRAGWVGVLLGYFAVWVAFAAGISGIQLALLSGGAIDMMGIPTSRWLAVGLLLAVGLFQFTRTKEICHGVCHSPMSYFLGHWRPDFAGGIRMGLGLGAFCAACCWGFMALGFVGGMMSLLWMGLATLFMVIEKLPDIGRVVTKPMGAVLIAGGVAVAIWPVLQI